jgi:hypothetical protein
MINSQTAAGSTIEPGTYPFNRGRTRSLPGRCRIVHKKQESTFPERPHPGYELFECRIIKK